jgi:hypothetical protein
MSDRLVNLLVHQYTYSVAVDSGNDGFLCLGHTRPVVQEVAHDALGVGVVLHLFDIRASREGLLAASDDNSANSIVRLEDVQSLFHFVHQRTAQGVQRLGPVEGDNGDILFFASLFGFDEFEGGSWRDLI